MGEKEQDKKPRKSIFFIDFEDELFQLFGVIRLKKDHKIQGENVHYRILLNSGIDESSNFPLIKNMIWSYHTEELRDQKWEILKEKISFHPAVAII